MNPLLGRWISADPLAVHAPGKADLNVYAYVKGAVLKAIDPIGLQDACPNGGCHEAPADSGSAIDEFEAAGVDTTPPSEEDVMGYLEGVQAQQEAQEAEVSEQQSADQAERVEAGRPAADSYGVECSGDCHQEGVVQGQTWTGAGEDTPVEGSLAPYFVQGLPILASEALSAGLLPSLELYMSTRIGMRMPRFAGAAETSANRVDTVPIFRAVGPEEYESVMTTGESSFPASGWNVKQFGRNLDETIKYADTNPDYAAILRVDVPTSSVEKFTNHQVDTFIFKQGTVGVEGAEQLKLLNSTMGTVEHAY